MAALLLLSGLTWAQTRTEEVTYTLDGTITGGSNGYATESEITQDGITWMVMGNTTMSPWRIGGKNLTNEDRPLYSTSAFSDDITKVVVTNGTASLTVNSMTLIVSANADFSNPTSTISGTWAASSTTTFERPADADWSNMYFKLVYNVTETTGSNKFAQFVSAEFYKEMDASAPSLSAENVEIAFDATSGEIEYTLSNPVAGGTLTANTTAEWLTLGTVGTTVPFTCSANEAVTARTATVTLTYTYNTEETITKNVTVTQAANPNVVNNISDITATGTYAVQGTIVAKSTRGFIVGDGTGYVYYYNQNYSQSSFAIGDKVKLSGAVSVYGGVYQFTNSATITSVETSNYVAEEPTVLTGEDMDARVASTTPYQLSNYIQYMGTLTIDGTHYNIIDIDGAQTAIGSISYPLNVEEITALNGKQVIVTGYYVGISTSTYYNTMLGSIEEVVGSVATPTFNPAAGSYSEAQSVTISCDTENASIYYTLDGTDPDDSSTLYNGPITVSTTTTIKAIAYDGVGNSSAIATATYTILAPITIAEVRAQATGDVITIGVVTSCVGTTGYIQDATAAICVYGVELTIGDEIKVSGTLSTYKGLLEIGSNNNTPTVQVLSSGNTVTPTVKTIAEINADDFTSSNSIQGLYVTIENATVTAIEGQNTTIAQGENTIVVRGISGVEYAVNDLLTLDGNIGCYNVAQIANPQNVIVTANTTPVIHATETVSLAYDATSGQFTYTIDNPLEDETLAAISTAEWISNFVIDNETVTFTTTVNDGEADRTATITLTYPGASDIEVTVTQGHYVIPPTPGDWVLTDLADLTEDDVFVIVGTYEDLEHDSYAMSNNNGTSKAPDAVGVVVAENTLSGEIADTLQWNIRITDDGYMFCPNGDTTTWLYCTSSNNGVRVGVNTNNVFNLTEEGYLQNDATGRYLGIYNTQDWRCYTTINNNIAGQSFAFYKKVTSSTATQTIALTEGANWFSTYLEITLDDLKAALVAALPNATSIVIKSKTQNTKYNGSSWRGALTWDLSKMYLITVESACEITLEGMPVDPAEHPATILAGQSNWIAFPVNEEMTLNEAFAGFNAVNGDVIKSKTGNAKYNGTSWRAQGLSKLEPGKGYLFNSAATTERTLTFPTSTK